MPNCESSKMMHLCRVLLLILFVFGNGYLGTCSMIACKSPQYLNYGEVGTISCSFDNIFLSVLWFDTVDYTQSEPVLHYQDFTKTGAGYESGEFDIFSNGSLVINNVSLQHDTTFTVVYVHTRKDDVAILNIEATVVVIPKTGFPLINHCGYSNKCFAIVTSSFAQCSVNNVRPNVTLQWLVRTADGDKNITQDMSISPEGVGYTSRVTSRDVFHYSSLLVLLVCKASSPRLLLDRGHSVVMVQNKNVSKLLKDRRVLYIDQFTPMKLNCTDNDIGFFVWEKVIIQENDGETEYRYDILLYSILLGEEEWIEVLANDVSLGRDASLVVDIADVRHDGLYYCIYGNGLTDSLTVYEVIIKVDPVPPYPVIERCSSQQYCVLEADFEGSLTCKLNGIRPQVQLEWRTVLGSDATAISFTKQHVTIKENKETFDVILTSTYRVTDRSRDRFTVECKVAESEKNLFRLTTKMDLLIVQDTFERTDETNLPPTFSRLMKIVPIVVALAFLLLAFSCGVIIVRYLWKRKTAKSRLRNGLPEEVSGMLQAPELNLQNLSGTKEQFLRQIKEKYKDLYEGVQPIPYIKDRMYCVNKVFVEGGIEFLDSEAADGTLGEWKSLETYENIFKDPRVKSTRRIIEGEPGYGKSTVTLQFAYDWCTSSQRSSLKDFDILILLRLRQLAGIASIYKAIKQFILPTDSTLSEKDIEKILRNCSSVVIILDGFDEYPHRDGTIITDIVNIISRNMFQEFEVVTTTRSSFLPKKYPALTKRVRLRGFDDDARRYYIRKAVVRENEERINEIEQYLQKNPILSDLCQVPLLFVIFAHLVNESEKFRKLNSVTSFFRHMISCFHSHMRNKMEDENVSSYGLFEEDHGELDMVAFEAVSGNAQKIVWDKDDLRAKIRPDLYDQYVRIGVLVEEKLVDIVDSPGTLISEHIKYKTEVRFYHKLFCEWYAAHYLCKYLQQNPNIDLTEFLQHLDPFDLQYTYRFACGLNSQSAQKLICYLKNIDGGEKFAILCLLEQTGKLEDFEKTIRQLCDEGIIISGHDSRLLQRSSMQLLEIATRNNIPIRGLTLHNCLESVNQSTSTIGTTSGQVLTTQFPIRELSIQLYNRTISKDEVVAILEFSSMCQSLKKLKFGGSPPPQFLTVGSSMSKLKSRNVSVKWQLFKNRPWYVLNFQTGQWEGDEDGKPPTLAEFQQMCSEFFSVMEQKSEHSYRKSIQKMRQGLREKTERRNQSY